MKISFENPDKINGLLTLTIEEDDYKASVEKELKDYRKRANIPGFRPGMAPMSMIKRQIGASVKYDVVNKVLSDNLFKYIQDNKINMLGSPLQSEKQEPQDLDKPAPYTFMFDIAVAPEINLELTSKDKVPFYTIKVDDELINRQVDGYASSMGKSVDAETYSDNDMVYGDLRELDADGNTLEGGITVDSAMIMPSYIKVDDQKKLFDGCKPGDIITINPRKAYPENDTEVSSLLKIKREEVADHTGDFSFQITSIKHYQKHEVDQELFDGIFGKDAVKSEDEFRAKVAEQLKAQFAQSSDFKFLQDLRAYCEKKVGTLTYPDALLKRIFLQNNKDKDQKFVDENYEGSIKELTWQLIRDLLAEQNNIKLEQNDLKEVAKATARQQFAQYGMANVPDEYVDNYADELLKKEETRRNFVDRAIELKLVDAVKKVVKLDSKEVSLDDFNKMVDEANK